MKHHWGLLMSVLELSTVDLFVNWLFAGRKIELKLLKIKLIVVVDVRKLARGRAFCKIINVATEEEELHDQRKGEQNILQQKKPSL